MASRAIGISHVGHNKVVDLSQDVRFKDKQKKLKKALIVHNNVKDIKKRSVDMKKVKMETIRPWITKKLRELLGFDDEIVMDYLINQLEEKQYPDPKEVQINITGFINGKNAKEFVGQLWPMLVSATENGTGIPSNILDAKKKEIQSRCNQTEISDGGSKSSGGKESSSLGSRHGPGPPPRKQARNTETIDLLSSDDDVPAPISKPKKSRFDNSVGPQIEAKEEGKTCFIEEQDDDNKDSLRQTNKPAAGSSSNNNKQDQIQVIDDDEIEFISNVGPQAGPQLQTKSSSSKEPATETITSETENLPDAVKSLLAYTEQVNDPTLPVNEDGGQPDDSHSSIIKDDKTEPQKKSKPATMFVDLDSEESDQDCQENATNNQKVEETAQNPDKVREKATADHDKFLKSVRKTPDKKSDGSEVKAINSNSKDEDSKDQNDPISRSDRRRETSREGGSSKSSRSARDRERSKDRHQKRHKSDRKHSKKRHKRDRSPSRKHKKSKRRHSSSSSSD